MRPCDKECQWHLGLHESFANMWTEVLCPLWLAMLRHMWVLHAVLGSPVKERHGRTEVSAVKVTKMLKGLKHLSYEERLQVLGVFSLERKRLRGILTMWMSTWSKKGEEGQVEGKGYGTRLFMVISSDGTRGNGHKSKYMKLH